MKIWKLRPGQQLRPIGGHHFIEDGVKFEGDTPEEVVTKLSDYRLNNGAPIGQPMQELLSYYAKNWPFMVDEDYGAEPPQTPSLRLTKWVEWVRSMWGKPSLKQITPKEAVTRWEVCLICPANVQLDPSTPEQMETKRKAFMLRRGQDVPAKLGFCSCHRWDLPSAVFIEAPVVVSGKLKDAVQPPNCWVA